MAWHGMAWHGMAWHGMAWHVEITCKICKSIKASPLQKDNLAADYLQIPSDKPLKARWWLLMKLENRRLPDWDVKKILKKAVSCWFFGFWNLEFEALIRWASSTWGNSWHVGFVPLGQKPQRLQPRGATCLMWWSAKLIFTPSDNIRQCPTCRMQKDMTYHILETKVLEPMLWGKLQTHDSSFSSDRLQL